MVDGVLSQVHLCEKCVQRLGYAGMFSAMMTGDIMGSMLQRQEDQAVLSRACDSCGRTLKHIQQSGLLGCARCYEVFGVQIESAIKQVQGRNEHLGKFPANFRPDRDRLVEIERSRKQLSEAIAGENYELAIELRDRIRAMESELQEGAS